MVGARTIAQLWLLSAFASACGASARPAVRGDAVQERPGRADALTMRDVRREPTASDRGLGSLRPVPVAADALGPRTRAADP